MENVWEHRKTTGNAQNVINLGNFFDWKEQNSVFEDMAAFFDNTSTLTSEGEPEEVPSQVVTSNLFPMLGVSPILGRGFLPEDASPNQPRVVLLSYGLWQRRYG